MRTHPSTTLAGLTAAAIVTGLLAAVAVAPPAGAAEASSAPSVRDDSLDVVGWDDALVGSHSPRLSWVVEDADRDEAQSAYQVEVTGPGGVVWDSGKVASAASTLRAYDGPALASGTSYSWRVKVWDTDDLASEWSAAASLRTGLLDLDDWAADWISVPSRHQARAEFAVDGLADGDRAVLYLAAQGNALARINGHRVSDEELGTTWTDWDQRVLYRGVDVTDLLVDGDNALGVTVAATHTVKVPDITVMAQLEVVGADGEREVVATTDDSWTSAVGGLTRVDAYRGERYDARAATTGWDSPGFDDSGWADVPVVAPVAGAPNLSTGATVTALDTVDCCGWGRSSLNDGVLVSTDSSQGYHSATATSADTTKWVQLDLGSSQPIGSVTMWGAQPTNDPAGSFPGTGFPVRYRIEASDDPGFATSQVVVDRTGADQPNPGATPVTEVPAAAVTGRYVRVTATRLPPSSDSFSFRLAELVVRGTDADVGWGLSPLEADPTPPMRVVDTIEPVAVTTVAPGVQRYDFGTNHAGWAQLTATAPAGTTAQVYLGEILDGNGRVTTDNQNFAPGEEQRQTYRYTFAGGGEPETWEPSFAYSGFRYAEVSGLPAGTEVTLVAREVHTDLQRESTLETGNPVLDGIDAASRQGQLIAMHGVPEDTPTREKKGWLGDAISTAAPIMDTFDADDMFRKYLGDVQTSIFEVDGGVPSVAPSRQSGREYKVDPAWAAGYPVILWRHYQREGDATLLDQHYADLARYVDYLDTIDDADRVVVDPEVTYGHDWQAVESTDPRMFHTLYYLQTVEILADIARVLDRDADATTYDALAAEITAGFNRRFLDRAAGSYGGTQLANAFPLLAGVVPADLEDEVLDRLVANIRDRGNHLTGGFVGTRIVIEALHEAGRDDVVLDTAVRTDYPSLGFMVKQGPGTIWEKWVESSAPDGTSSRSHPALAGGMHAWFYAGLAGITSLEPGYRRISLRMPDLGASAQTTHGSASIESPQGTVSSDWTRAGDDLTYAVEVPVGTTAEVSIPAGSRYAVTEGGRLLDDVDGVHDVEAADGRVTVTIGSGSYDFAASNERAALGAVLDDVDGLRSLVDELATAGDLSSTDAEHLTDGLDGIRGDLVAALVAALAGEDVVGDLATARAGVAELRTWLASSSVAGPVRGRLDRRLGDLDAAISRLVAAALGVSVVLPPVATPALPGTTVSGAVEIANDSRGALTGVTGTVAVAGFDPVEVSLDAVAADATAQLPVSLRLPVTQAPGELDATVDLRFTAAGAEQSVVVTTRAWATVTSGLTLGDPAATVAPGDPAERMTLAVPVTNGGVVEVRAHVAVEGGVPSPEVVVPPGGTATAQVSAVLPLARVAGDVPVTLVARQAGVRLASRTASVRVGLTTPPAGATDHVDLGNTPSEQAHALQASAASGTSPEAGLSRRYTTTTAGQWFSAEVAVPPRTPFVVRAVETFDDARTKRYDVSVDGTRVSAVTYARTATGPGTMTYDLLVDDPDVLDHDGTVRLRYEYPTGAGSSFDASIADVWVFPVGADTTAPEVGAEVVGGTPGASGWLRSEASVEVRAVDTRDRRPVVETGTSAGWQAYAGPVTVSGEGRHTVSYRASDTAGNGTGERSLDVRIDSVAPTTSVRVEPRGSSERAALLFASTDATSGVAATTYRVDGGEWRSIGAGDVLVSGAGEHVVEFSSTDHAGNVEPLGRMAFELAADVPPVVTPPVVTPPVVTPPVVTPVTPPAGKAASRVRVTLSRTSVPAGATVRVRARVSSTGARPAGKVRFVVDGKVVRTVRLAKGKATVRLVVRRGRHKVVVRYLGSPSVKASASAKQVLRGT